ncbi:unnamed protein product, partial [Brassica rapa subsp. trilocularis]
NFSLLAISALRLLYLQTSSSSGDRRVAALLAPPPFGRMKCVAEEEETLEWFDLAGL